MRDFLDHQASGLLELAPHSHNARLMAVVSHGDDATELPLLWRMCSSLAHFGYPVTVLDGTMAEGHGNLGLSHMLDQAYWPGRSSLDDCAWPIIASATGLRELGESHGGAAAPPLVRLGTLFPSESVVIVYAKAEVLAAVLRATSVVPVLVTSPAKGSLLTSYLAIKQLLALGNLQALALCVDHPGARHPALPAAQLAAKLHECCRTYLGLDISVRTLKTADPQQPTDPELQRLVLRMLENSLCLPARAHYPAADARQLSTGTFVRGH